jgi:glycosyltransferase involved in cell wall biosynthesis
MGTGKRITAFPSGSSHHQHDLLARGLAERGHTVFYHVDHDDHTIADKGVHFVNHLMDDIDIVHFSARNTPSIRRYYQSKGLPVVATNHLYVKNETPPIKWVHVSKMIASLYNAKYHNWCGLDPKDYNYQESKEDYFFFMADISRYKGKGLKTALELSHKLNKKLVVAGSSRKVDDILEVENLCNQYNALYVGDVRGQEKAKWFAEATAFVSPSNYVETFGITLVEALFSGTPVICSDKGAYSEIITPEVGFVCTNEKEYINAFEKVNKIKAEVCRSYAMQHFHYLKNTDNYIRIYQEILASKKNKTQIVIK